MPIGRLTVTAAIVAASTVAAEARAQSFVNWESPHVHPIDATPSGARILAVNTADNRLEVFDVQSTTLVRAGAIPVGLDPVSVRARTETEAWVVNHVSDSITIVDLATMAAKATINTGDEPADVVFAGAPARAFVTISQRNRVHVYDPADLAAAPIVVPIAGEDPRALATDGDRVFAAIFESGNGTTILDQDEVSNAGNNPYPGNPNPVPNAGLAFDPPIEGSLPSPPAVGQIVRKDPDSGQWLDGNGFDWSSAVTWDLHDHDVAVIDADDLAVTYVSGLMNVDMALAVHPGGDVFVVGTEATNEVRFEPNLAGRFVRSHAARFTPPAGTATAVVDLNPHLDYTTGTVSQALRDQSLADPRGIAWNAAGDRAVVTGMGSRNVIIVDAALARVGRVDVGAGPTGVTIAANGLAYVLDKFEGAISVVDVDAATELDRVAFFDPTPPAIRLGRPLLYDARLTSGLGLTACGSCHVDGRMDQLAWDLGDPQGAMKENDQFCNFGAPGSPLHLCEDWHPMKGPMTTQTLVGIIGSEPLHWRGDRGGFEQFNPAFVGLLGDDAELSDTDIIRLETFIATLTYPPNPNRDIDGSLKTSLTIDGLPPRTGNPAAGAVAFNSAALDGINCVACHSLPTGTNGQLTSAGLIQESQSMKIPQLRNLHEKTGFERTGTSNNRGFGFIHDGSVDTLFEFLEFPGFQFTSDQQQRDVEAFMHSFSTDTHAGVGVQATVGGAGVDGSVLRDELLAIADAQPVDLVAKGFVAGEHRGFRYDGGGTFQSDRAGETWTTAQLDAASGPAAAITYTLVPPGGGTRIGIDRDEDGVLDRDELDQCSDPTDAASTTPAVDPACCAAIAGADAFCGALGWDAGCADLAGVVCAPCSADTNGDGLVDVTDLVNVVLDWGTDGATHGGDVDGSGLVDVTDLVAVILAWGTC